MDDFLVYKRRDRYLCELTDVYVHPLRRGQGWARSAVEAALKHADDSGWDVFLRVIAYGKDTSNAKKLSTEALVAFYGRCGFVSRRIDPRCMVRRWRAN